MVKITVIGSCSIDLTVQSDRRPLAGETVIGRSLTLSPGGKGANQAVAAARLGAQVNMVGCVGDDDYGRQIISNLKDNGVDTSYVQTISEQSSGTAHITLAEGDNSIIVIKGANDSVSKSVVDEAGPALESADIVLLQLEIPLPAVVYTIELCRRLNVPVLLNPAPVSPIREEVLHHVTYLTPNQHEAALLFTSGVDQALKKYPNQLLVTKGSQGVRFFDGKEIRNIAAFQTAAVDTTGAGDTFNGAFAVAVSEGKPIHDSILFANAAAALSVRKLGAQSGMPDREQVESLLKEHQNTDIG
ncbi:ribokinase [Sporolactobacillus sp. THM7-4]|nr:ribokinase [Sporolactobacillus sp. THM7-4]